MVRPAQRRALVSWAQESYALSERRACRAESTHRSTIRYRSVRRTSEPIRRRLRELAAVRLRSGYRQLRALLRREGCHVNHKRVFRLYKEDGLVLGTRRRRRARAAVRRPVTLAPERANEVSAMDFVHDVFADKRSFRVRTVIDVHSRECLVLEAGKGFTGRHVGELLSAAARRRGGAPARIRLENGTEFTSKALDVWAHANRVELSFSRAGKPTDNAFIEAFNGRLRQQCLSQHWLLRFQEVQLTLNAWRRDYSEAHPHCGLGGRTPWNPRRRSMTERRVQFENSRTD